MKYLKPLSAVLLGRCGNNIWKTQTEDYTTTVVGTLVNENGTDEQLCGIYVTRSQLEQIRNEIDNYLQNTAERKQKLGIADSLRESEATPVTFNVNMTGDSKLSKEEMGKLLLDTAQQVTKIQRRQSNNTEQKQRFKINPKLIKIEQSVDETSSGLYRASIDDWRNLTDNRAGYIYLYGLGVSEEEARARLNAQFETLILQFVDTEVITSKTSSVTSADSPEKADDTLALESEKIEPQKIEEKNQDFKLNPNRVASRIDHNVAGYAQWEARTTLYFGETPLEVVCSKQWTEQSARKALDYKVKQLINRLTD